MPNCVIKNAVRSVLFRHINYAVRRVRHRDRDRLKVRQRDRQKRRGGVLGRNEQMHKYGMHCFHIHKLRWESEKLFLCMPVETVFVLKVYLSGGGGGGGVGGGGEGGREKREKRERVAMPVIPFPRIG